MSTRTAEGAARVCSALLLAAYTSQLDFRATGLTIPVTDHNRELLRSGYEAAQQQRVARSKVRGGSKASSRRWQEFLIVILYSHERPWRSEGSPIGADWGIVGCVFTSGAGRGTPWRPSR